MRADAVASRKRILQAAATLAGDRGVSMAEIAAAAGVGRSTLYRHFPTPQALDHALAEADTDAEAHGVQPDQREPERAARPIVATHAVSGRGAARPRRAAGARGHARAGRGAAASRPRPARGRGPSRRRRAGRALRRRHRRLASAAPRRLAGVSRPHRRPAGARPRDRARGPPRVLRSNSSEQLPGCVAEPLWLRGRVTGLLLCIGTPGRLADRHRQAGSRRAGAGQRLHRFHRGRPPAQAHDARRRDPAEPVSTPHRPDRGRPARRSRCYPATTVGGDWFDFVENRDGAWLAIADAAGNGPTAAGLGAAALGALRAARRAGSELEQACRSCTTPCASSSNDDFYVTALVARWHAATAKLTLDQLRTPPGLPRRPRRQPERAARAMSIPLSAPASKHPTFDTSERRLSPGERVVLLTDGITGRHIGRRRHVRRRRPANRDRERRRSDRRLHRHGHPASGHRLLARTARGRRHRRRHGRRLTQSTVAREPTGRNGLRHRSARQSHASDHRPSG